jgi:hypothetical protein
MYAPLAFKFQYLDYQGSPADLETFVQGAIFDGDNTYITGEGNLLSGSIFIGNSVGSGIELAGVNSAFIRSIGYMGFTSGSRAIDPRSGFMIYSGSVLPDSGDNYVGVGVELVSSADSYLRYRTNADGLGNGELDVRTQKFFLGSSTSFISGSGDGTIAISSSNFELTNTGDVTMQGTITATAGGTIGGATIESASLAFAPYWRISASADATDPVSFISSSAFKVSADGRISEIAGWNIDNEKMSNTGVHLSSSYGLKVFDGVDDGLDFVEMKYKASDNWGLVGKESGQEIFQLGNQNQIAGWSFDQNKIISNYGVNSPTNPGIVIKSEGTIETDPFISGLTANATGWQIRADGRAEFENAVIRGTLSTAVFEKDTISVVGGQVMIANAAKVDNVNPRFTDYPYLKSAIGENINWSGEQSPITGSSIRSSSLFL